jgi:hypothetical protein
MQLPEILERRIESDEAWARLVRSGSRPPSRTTGSPPDTNELPNRWDGPKPRFRP